MANRQFFLGVGEILSIGTFTSLLLFFFLGNMDRWTFKVYLIHLKNWACYWIFFYNYHCHHLILHLGQKPCNPKKEPCNFKFLSFYILRMQGIIQFGNITNNPSLWHRFQDQYEYNNLLMILLVWLEVMNMRISHWIKVPPFLKLECPFNY